MSEADKKKEDVKATMRELKRIAKLSRKLGTSSHLAFSYNDESKPWADTHHVDFVVRRVAAKGRAESTETVRLAGAILTGKTSDIELVNDRPRFTTDYKPRDGYWDLYGCSNVAHIIELLPADATVAFNVLLDRSTHRRTVAHGLHVDVLQLHAYWERGEKLVERFFDVDTVVVPHGAERIGSPDLSQGGPNLEPLVSALTGLKDRIADVKGEHK